jgi:hypothetical protein
MQSDELTEEQAKLDKENKERIKELQKMKWNWDCVLCPYMLGFANTEKEAIQNAKKHYNEKHSFSIRVYENPLYTTKESGGPIPVTFEN